MSSEPTSADIVIGRLGDPIVVIVDRTKISFIERRKKSRLKNPETFRTGGLTFYDHEGETLFSLPMPEALSLVPQEILNHFNFPRSEQYPRGIINSEQPPQSTRIRVELSERVAA